jgi:hypothetical protein
MIGTATRKRRKPAPAPEPTPADYAAALEQARQGDPSAAIALGANPYAARLLCPAYRAARERERAERQAAWDTTPRKLFGHDLDAARAAGWRFERDKQGYHGNPPPFYAISPTGYRYVWNNSMRHGGADPWEPVGQDPAQPDPEGTGDNPAA